MKAVKLLPERIDEIVQRSVIISLLEVRKIEIHEAHFKDHEDKEDLVGELVDEQTIQVNQTKPRERTVSKTQEEIKVILSYTRLHKRHRIV